MPYTIVVGGRGKLVHLGGRRTLAEILSDAEYELVHDGDLVAVTEGGGIMDLSSPMAEDQVVTLRPIEPDDLRIFLLPGDDEARRGAGP